ncbi:MAG: polysaccharide pyruvyl transferase family protein [Deltaproteobacteria bacterium]|nr:polysaccharide pyruvyl transferase family protein [Deltaproteobacteria bacterium]
MKYGLLVNENNSNIGDDIQSYAAARFMPRVDVLVDRENLDIFKLKKFPKEPVAVIMGAWFMWKKYNWPPAGQIIPLLVGYHHFERREDPLANAYAIPVYREHYDGIGGDWFRAYSPIGCRDLFTCEVFTEKNIPNYFSGCVTLTLPKQPETEDRGKYIVFVDLNKDVENKIRSMVGDKYEIRVVSHTTPNINGATWEERAKRVEGFLTLYQNAKYVVTRRLHVSLPCLAMGVPVMCIQSKTMNDPNRFDPYKSWLHFCNNNDFLKNGYTGFDFLNGTPNKRDYLRTREELAKRIQAFVAYCEENKDKKLAFFDKRSYSKAEENEWRVKFMRKILNRTHKESKEMQQALLAAKES